MAGFDPDAYLAQASPAAPAFDPDAYLNRPSVLTDVAQSLPTGLAKGAIGFAGAPADTNTLNKTIGSKIGDVLGVSPETQAKIGHGYDMASRTSMLGPILGIGNILPGAEKIRSGVENVTGPLHEPQTVPGQYAQTLGEFVPALIGNRSSLARNALTNVALPAVASETAGQLSSGTAAEPYLRLGAALASPVAAEKVLASRATAAATRAATPTIDEAKASAIAGFKAPEVTAVTFKPGTIDNVSNMITSDLKRAKLNDRLAPQTHAIIDEMKTPVNGAAHTYEDVQTTRQILGEVAGNFANPVEQKAATQAIKTLDRLMSSMPQSKVATGDIAVANAKIATARGDYASAKTAERVQEKLNNADLRAASTYSGGNLNNATRQNLRTLLTSKKGGRGLTSDELQTIEDTVRGSTLGNVTRMAGKLLGGGGGIGSIGTAAAGHMLAGPLGLAAPLVGYGVKKIGDAITRSNSNKIVAQILQRSPLGMQRAAANPIPQAQRLNLLKALLLSNAATLPARMPVGQMQP